MPRRALITGITGQDGSYLAEHLLGLGYEVHGIVRRVALEDQRHRLGRIAHLVDRLELHVASIDSYPTLFQVLARVKFDECYHLAAQSFVAETFADGFATMNVNLSGTHYLLAGLQQLQPGVRFYLAGSSEMFGRAERAPQDERTPFNPRSPYGVSKLCAYHLARNFREAHGMFCCTGILFNHESPRRGFEYVTRKITSTAARIRLGLATDLPLGNLDARRDWGHAREYVEAMHLMLQQPHPGDYVVATGETHSVREVCELAFGHLGLDYRSHVRVEPRYLRSGEDTLLVGDPSKAARDLGWRARTPFPELVREMVEADLALARTEAAVRDAASAAPREASGGVR